MTPCSPSKYAVNRAKPTVPFLIASANSGAGSNAGSNGKQSGGSRGRCGSSPGSCSGCSSARFLWCRSRHRGQTVAADSSPLKLELLGGFALRDCSQARRTARGLASHCTSPGFHKAACSWRGCARFAASSPFCVPPGTSKEQLESFFAAFGQARARVAEWPQRATAPRRTHRAHECAASAATELLLAGHCQGVGRWHG